ncbi:tyrosine-protein kinase [soil metagenome]
MESGKYTSVRERNMLEAFMYRYLPYWPLFTILLIFAGAGAFAYLKYIAKPVYEITANILVDDEKKGADESKLMQALNISSNTIVDNEIELIQSKELLKEIIDSLQMYAPVFEKGPVVSYSAYNTSPINVILQNPSSIGIPLVDGYDFTYNKKNNAVSMEGKTYPLEKWLTTSFGTAKFIKNPHLTTEGAGPFYFSLTNPRKVLEDLALRLIVAPASKLSSVIILTLDDEVPERGEYILNLLIRAYYRSAINTKNLLAANTLSFVQRRIQTVAQELDSIENKLQQFRNQKGAINLSEQGRLYLQSVSVNDEKMTDVNMQLAMLGQVEKYVTSKDNKIGIVPSISGIKDDQLLSQLVQKLYESQMQYERLKKTIPEGNPTMYSLQNEIDNMRPTILENIKNQKESLLAGKSSLSDGTGKFVSMLQSIPQKEKQLLDISRQQAIKNDAYAFLLQKREESELAYAAMVTTSKTIYHANAGFTPVSPKKAFVFLSAIVIAFIIGFLFVNSKESLTNKIMFRSDIESITSLPIVAEITRIQGKQPLFLDINNQKQLGYIEQFHQLRFGIGLNGKLSKYKKILVTSGSASEGKSFISNNLALSLAQSGKKVALVDFDFRNPKTSGLYQLAGSNGLAEYFEDGELSLYDIIYPTDNQTLYVIPAGVSKTNPTELLLKKDFAPLFSYLETNFDYVIMDTAPVDPIIDAFLVSEYCDAILFVIRHGYTKKAMLESMQKSQKINALKNVFIVFNGIKARGFLKNGYGFGYGYGSSKMYGAKDYQGGK